MAQMRAFLILQKWFPKIHFFRRITAKKSIFGGNLAKCSL